MNPETHPPPLAEITHRPMSWSLVGPFATTAAKKNRDETMHQAATVKTRRACFRAVLLYRKTSNGSRTTMQAAYSHGPIAITKYQNKSQIVKITQSPGCRESDSREPAIVSVIRRSDRGHTAIPIKARRQSLKSDFRETGATARVAPATSSKVPAFCPPVNPRKSNLRRIAK